MPATVCQLSPFQVSKAGYRQVAQGTLKGNILSRHDTETDRNAE